MDTELTGEFLAGRLRSHLSQDDLAIIDGLVIGAQEYSDGECIVARGIPINECHLLLEGFVFRTIKVDNRRRIVGVNVPGDFIDLHGFALNPLDHDLISAGTAKVGLVPHDRLRKVIADRPNICSVLWSATLLDAAIQRRWIQILGQLDTLRRIAHIYAELHERLELIGRRTPRVLRTPFTQIDLGDMCGVSAVHTNRAVGKLRDSGLCEIRRGDLYTDDWDELKRFAGFDPSYLYGSRTQAAQLGNVISDATMASISRVSNGNLQSAPTGL